MRKSNKSPEANDQAPNKKRGSRRVAAVIAAASLAVAACSTDRPAPLTSKEKKPGITARASEALPKAAVVEVPKGGDFEVAAKAAWLAMNDQNFTSAAFLLDKINDPIIKAQAARAIELSKARKASWEALNDDKFMDAEATLETVTDPVVKASGEKAVDLAEAEASVWNAHNANDFATANNDAAFIEDPVLRAKVDATIASSQLEHDLLSQGFQEPGKASQWNNLNQANVGAWDDLKTQAVADWYDLKTGAASAWYDLYIHTAAYQDQQDREI